MISLLSLIYFHSLSQKDITPLLIFYSSATRKSPLTDIFKDRHDDRRSHGWCHPRKTSVSRVSLRRPKQSLSFVPAQVST